MAISASMSVPVQSGEGIPPAISIAMATYNGEKYIREQLESLARQSLRPAELVVADDGSTDATLSILESFASVAPFPVRVFRNASRLGYEENFLKAASLCTGELIAFCDQDDIWMEHKLSLCSKYFADPSIEGVVHSGQTMWDTGERGRLHPFFPKTQVLDAGEFDPFAESPGFSIMFRRDLLSLVDSAGRHNRLKSHDKWCWLLVSGAGRVVTMAEVLVLYRQHGTNVFGAPPKRTLLGVIRNSASVQQFAEEADSEASCARVLESAAEHDLNRAAALRRSARKFRYRSKLHWIRTTIYAERSSIFKRVLRFARVMALGGYFPDRSRARLGFKCGVKDLLLGVSGVYKLVPPSRPLAEAGAGQG
jgi:glycosyltransferase involved in cell wall biosynthesis